MMYLFPKSVETVDIDLSDTDRNLLIKRAYQLKQGFSGKNNTWWCNTWSSLDVENSLFQQDEIDPIIVKLKNKLAEKVSQYATDIGANNPEWYLRENDFWFNIAKPGDYQEIHNHTTPKSNGSISAVYYLQVPKNSGDLIVFDQNYFHGSSIIPDKVESHTFTPAPNAFVIFTSELPHLVTQNLSQEDRISIAVNYIFKRKQNG